MIKNKNYKKFAKVYDLIMGDRSKDAKIYLDLIHKYQPKAKDLLDSATGTGEVLKYFNDFNIFGIDESGEMLKIAKSKIKNAVFLNNKITNFKIDKKFDVITCMFDSINHLQTMEEWNTVFKLVEKHLKDGGIFIFDINMDKKIQRLSKIGTILKFFTGGFMHMKIIAKENNVSSWNVKIFQESNNNNSFKMSEENILEKTFNIDQIKKELSNFFSKIEIIDFEQNDTFKEERLYLICFL